MAFDTDDLAGLRVLQTGPLYVNHVRRWSQLAGSLGCEVHVAGHVRPGRTLVRAGDVAASVEVEPPELTAGRARRREAWLRGVIERVRPDLVQAHWLWTWGSFAARVSPVPVVLTPWGSDIYLGTGADRRRADRALAGASRVIARSAHMQREIAERGVSSERIHRVDLGVDLERFRPVGEPERAALRAELGLGDGPVILSFRAGASLYNLDRVLRAFAIVRKRAPGATLLLVPGDRALDAGVKAELRRAEDDGAVQVVGPVAHDQMHRYMAAASVGVSIPDSDGSPNSVWEALACGLPLVLSNLPQVAEKLGGSGAAEMAGPTDDSVADALTRILADPARRESMAREARSWAEHNADQRDQAALLAELYRGLAAPAPLTPSSL